MTTIEQQQGWTAVPRSLSKLINDRPDPHSPSPIKVSDIELPDSPLVRAALDYAEANLPKPTLSHSMRVFFFGRIVTTQHFPTWTYSAETFLLACLLHDIGTTDLAMNSTHLSFEFWGGMTAYDLLIKNGASKAQAESVCETIIRHQDVGETGNVSELTAAIHFATLLDNAGGNAELVHEESIKSVVAKYPREKWTGCFAGVVRRETARKPWSHTTKIEGFAEMVEGNKVMEPYD